MTASMPTPSTMPRTTGEPVFVRPGTAVTANGEKLLTSASNVTVVSVDDTSRVGRRSHELPFQCCKKTFCAVTPLFASHVLVTVNVQTAEAMSSFVKPLGVISKYRLTVPSGSAEAPAGRVDDSTTSNEPVDPFANVTLSVPAPLPSPDSVISSPASAVRL